jgi:hypothetical protein
VLKLQVLYFGALKFQGLWSTCVLKFYVETTRPLVGLLGVLKVSVEVMYHPSLVFLTFLLKLHITSSMF